MARQLRAASLDGGLITRSGGFLRSADFPETADAAGRYILSVSCAPEVDLLRVDHHHVVAHVGWGEGGCSLPRNTGDAGGQPAEHLAVRIHEEPLAVDLSFLGHHRRHVQNPSLASEVSYLAFDDS